MQHWPILPVQFPARFAFPAMTQGTVLSYDPRRGTGYLRSSHTASEFPFVAQPDAARTLREGDPVAFSIAGGRIGILARDVRRLRADV